MAAHTGSSQSLPKVLLESVQIPPGLEVFDRKLTTKDFQSVYRHLTHLSSRWDTIGGLLVGNVAALDEIDANYKSVAGKLMHMLDSWLRNAEDCTWRTLIAALQKDNHTEEARSIICQVLEGEVPIYNLRTRTENPWEELRELICKMEQEFHSELLSAVQNECMVFFREMITFQASVSDEHAIEKIDLLVNMHIEAEVSAELSACIDIVSILEICSSQKSFYILVELLIAHLNKVNESLQNLTAHKESLKESMFQLEAGTGSCRQRSNDDHVLEQRMRNRTQASDVSRQIEDTTRYRQYLFCKLDTCTTHLHKVIHQNRVICDAVTTVTTAYKEEDFIKTLILLFAISMARNEIMLYYYALIGLVVLLMVKKRSYIDRIYDVVKRCVHCHVLLKVAVSGVSNRKFVSAVLGLLIAMGMLQILEEPPPASPEPPPPYHELSVYVLIQIQELHVVIQIFMKRYFWVVLYLTGTLVAWKIKGKMGKFRTLLAVTFFSFDRLTWCHWHMLWSFFMCIFNVLDIDIYRCVDITTTYIFLSLAIPTGSQTAHWIVSGYMSPVLATVISVLAGAIVTLCSLWLFTRISIPYIYTNCSEMTSAAEHLEDSISKLEVMEANIISAKRSHKFYSISCLDN